MKCNSCQETISPKMRKAVENNICPFCGDKIVPDELRKSLSELDNVLIFLLDKFETETFDYLKDRYGITNRPQGPARTSRPVSHDEEEDYDDSHDVDDDDIPLNEKLKNKNFRKKYLAANKIKGTTPVNEFASMMGQEDDDLRRSSRDDDDYYVNQGNEVDAGLERQLAALAAKKASGGKSTDSDLEKLEKMISKSKKAFSPPSF